MRKAIVALLALSPMMLHAQANSPAQTQSAANTVLESKLAAPKAFVASANDSTPVTRTLRISTGVTAPKIISTVDIAAVSNSPFAIAADRVVVVSMVVDEKGKPGDLKIVKSAGAPLDENVLAAVSQYRFKPGTLNHEPTPIPLNLEITILRAGR